MFNFKLLLFFIWIVCAVNITTCKASYLDDPAKIQLIDHAISNFMRAHEIPGVAVAVFDGNHERMFNYGVADKSSGALITENTIFEIASVTKVFTTTALAIHVLQGDMSLEDPLSKYIPQLAHQNFPLSRVTLLQLATHTSSLPRVGGNWRTGGLLKIIRHLKNWHPESPIGTKYEYSNLAFGLLGYALENVEKRLYEDVIKQNILVPLGMHMTFVAVPKTLFPYYASGYTKNEKKASRRPNGYIPGSGALRSTSKDLLKFLKANMKGIGPEKLVKAMQLAQQPFFKVRKNFVMGLGWQRFNILGRLLIDKNGGLEGYTSYIGWIPEKNLGMIILTNKTKARTTGVGRFLLEHL